jgi:hypothetical protein
LSILDFETALKISCLWVISLLVKIYRRLMSFGNINALL